MYALLKQKFHEVTLMAEKWLSLVIFGKITAIRIMGYKKCRDPISRFQHFEF